MTSYIVGAEELKDILNDISGIQQQGYEFVDEVVKTIFTNIGKPAELVAESTAGVITAHRILIPEKYKGSKYKIYIAREEK